MFPSENVYLFEFWKTSLLKIWRLFPALFSQNFLRNFLLSRIINYWGSIFTLYLTCGALSLVCVISVFFFFLSFCFFFFFYLYFPWQTLTIHKTAETEKVSLLLFFYFYQLTNIHLVVRDFYHFFFLDLFCNHQSNSWWDMFYWQICILFAFSLIQLSRSYWLSYFKVTLWESELISNYHPSITKQTA